MGRATRRHLTSPTSAAPPLVSGRDGLGERILFKKQLLIGYLARMGPLRDGFRVRLDSGLERQRMAVRVIS